MKAAGAAALAVLMGCASVPAVRVRPPVQDGTGIRLHVRNGSHLHLCAVQVTPGSARVWGSNWVASSPLAPGSEVVVALASRPGTFDVRAKDCGGHVVFTLNRVALSGAMRLNLHD